MSLAFIDFLTYVLFGLKILAITLALLMFLLGLDDLFIDLCYWGRKLIRRFRIYDKFEKADEKRLYEVPEKPLAIMVPAWNVVGVVGEMAHLAASTIDYENYQIFVGTYPNDPQPRPTSTRCACTTPTRTRWCAPAPAPPARPKILAFCLLALCLPATADQRLFYQPLNRDASITPAQWQQLWHATVA